MHWKQYACNCLNLLEHSIYLPRLSDFIKDWLHCINNNYNRSRNDTFMGFFLQFQKGVGHINSASLLPLLYETMFNTYHSKYNFLFKFFIIHCLWFVTITSKLLISKSDSTLVHQQHYDYNMHKKTSFCSLRKLRNYKT